ncbi:hypothetical protein LshimejAT787_0800310 [Lyophyllum shimeji]|uniref:Uncharacterized protein n=1 Tax=Lyophyllum shimeji TaxID=47721 RepID=A0A9P3PQG9_LYOSH|nr:hypothetical protein LshimejAT787_0800310 [Lyophyllum shimeji]
MSATSRPPAPINYSESNQTVNSSSKWHKGNLAAIVAAHQRLKDHRAIASQEKTLSCPRSRARRHQKGYTYTLNHPKGMGGSPAPRVLAPGHPDHPYPSLAEDSLTLGVPTTNARQHAHYTHPSSVTVFPYL